MLAAWFFDTSVRESTHDFAEWAWDQQAPFWWKGWLQRMTQTERGSIRLPISWSSLYSIFPFNAHRGAWSQGICARKGGHVVGTPWHVPARIYWVIVFCLLIRFEYWYLGAPKWSIPHIIWSPKCGNLIPPFQKKNHLCFIVAFNSYLQKSSLVAPGYWQVHTNTKQRLT